VIGSKAQRGTIIAGAFGLALSISARAQTTTRVSLGSQSQESIAGGQLRPGVSLTPDGRRVAFASTSPDLVTGDTNSNWDVFVRDRLTGAVERCSVSTGGVQGNALSGLYGICVSAFGRFVAYGSRASNLVAGDTNRVSDVFLRDLVVDTTERISVDSAGIEGDGTSQHPALSADGRFVAFTSIATNLVAGDTNAQFDVFVRDPRDGDHGTRQRLVSGRRGARPELPTVHLVRRPVRRVRKPLERARSRRHEPGLGRVRARSDHGEHGAGQPFLGRRAGKRRVLGDIDLERRPVRRVLELRE
jgi:hypothetical protein